MPGEEIDRANPEPMPSHVSELVLSLNPKAQKETLLEDASTALKDFRGAACYIAAGERAI